MITVGKGPFPSGILASRVKEKPPGLANSISVLNSADAVKGRIRNRVASFRFHREYFTCLLCQNAVREKMNRTSTVWKRGIDFEWGGLGSCSTPINSADISTPTPLCALSSPCLMRGDWRDARCWEAICGFPEHEPKSI